MVFNIKKEVTLLKVKRSERLIDMTRYLLERPHTLVSLTYFANRYDSAKSSISEDLTIVKKTFRERGTGTLETVPGAAGGVKFIPAIQEAESSRICERDVSTLIRTRSFTARWIRLFV